LGKALERLKDVTLIEEQQESALLSYYFVTPPAAYPGPSAVQDGGND